MTRTDDDRVVHILDAIELIGRLTAEHPHDDIYRWLVGSRGAKHLRRENIHTSKRLAERSCSRETCQERRCCRMNKKGLRFRERQVVLEPSGHAVIISIVKKSSLCARI